MTRKGGVAAFIVERCLPVYPVFLVLWVFAVESMTVVIGDGPAPWRPSTDTAMKVLALMAAGVFMRMVDDQKDLDYDRRHHPTRPLVQEWVTPSQLRIAMAPAAVLALVLAAAVSSWAFALLAAALGYSLGLWGSEIKVGMLRDNAIVNLAAACPIQFLVTGFSMAGEPGVKGALPWQLAAVPVLFTSAFLHVEIARKTTRTNPAVTSGHADRHSYSELIGGTASAVSACVCALIAVLLNVLLSRPWSWVGGWWPVAWLPLVTAVLPLASAWIFLRGRAAEHPRPLPTVFVIVLYLAIICQGLAA